MTVKIINCDTIAQHNTTKMFTENHWFYTVQHFAAEYCGVEIIDPIAVDYQNRNVLFLCVDNPCILDQFDLSHFKKTITDHKNLTIYVSFSLEFWLDNSVLGLLKKLLNEYPLATFYWGGSNEYHSGTVEEWMNKQYGNHMKDQADWSRVNMVVMPVLDVGFLNHVRYNKPVIEKLPLEKKFLMLNNKTKPFRAALYLWCKYNKILPESYYSWRYDSVVLMKRKTPWEFSTSELKFLEKVVDLDPENTQDIICKQWDSPPHIPASSFMHVVIETLFDEIDNGAPALFITEKTYKPIYYKQPFIMVGCPYTLKHLKMLGYKTFDSIIDESYDSIEDPVLRMNAICKEIAKINSKSLDELEVLRKQIEDIVEHNHNHMFTDPGQVIRRKSLERILFG